MSASGGVCKKVKSWGDDDGLGSVFLIHDAQTEPLYCFFFFCFGCQGRIRKMNNWYGKQTATIILWYCQRPLYFSSLIVSSPVVYRYKASAIKIACGRLYNVV